MSKVRFNVNIKEKHSVEFSLTPELSAHLQSGGNVKLEIGQYRNGQLHLIIAEKAND